MSRLDTDRKTFAVPNVEHLAYLATIVAVSAPARASSYSGTAYIPWSLINEIRAALDAVGFDWKTAATKRFELERKAARDRQEAKYGKPRYDGEREE